MSFRSQWACDQQKHRPINQFYETQMSIKSTYRISRERVKGLQNLGVSEDDVHLAERLLKQIPVCSDPNKAERIFGYATSRLEREKALRLLGATEEEIEIENTKNLGALGIAGRRRSYSVIETSPSKPIYLNRKPSTKKYRHSSFDSATRQQKRRTSMELRRLRNQSIASSNEIEALKSRIDELENLVQRVASLTSDQTSGSSRRSSVSIVEN